MIGTDIEPDGELPAGGKQRNVSATGGLDLARGERDVPGPTVPGKQGCDCLEPSIIIVVAGTRWGVVIAPRIAQKLRLPEFVVRGLLQQARSWPADRISMVFEEIFQASSLSKSSRAEPGIVLERLLLRLPELRA